MSGAQGIAMSDDSIAANGRVDRSVRGFAFWKYSVVRHRNGTEYIIHETPERCRIEAGNVPAYLYSEKWYAPDNKLWARPQTEMEDGRFEMVEGGPYADLYAPNVPHEEADAASSRTLPLDVVVGPRG